MAISEEDKTNEEPSEADAAGEAPEQSAEGAEQAVDAQADEAGAEPAEPAGEAAPSAPAEEAEPVAPKQRRKLARSRSTGPAAPQRSPEERAGERADRRGRKAADRSRWRSRRGDRPGSKAKPPIAGQAPAPKEPSPGTRKQRQGIVVSNKADKTITVRIDLVRSHPVYGKVVHETSTLHAHDERNQAGEGDVVRVVECRPLSRLKRWRLVEVVEKAR
jgi:small subunit ribosomal protein S17